jgi:hypothetical protein
VQDREEYPGNQVRLGIAAEAPPSELWNAEAQRPYTQTELREMRNMEDHYRRQKERQDRGADERGEVRERRRGSQGGSGCCVT